MRKKNLSALKSVQRFKNEVEETHILIHALETQVDATRQTLSFIKADSKPDYHRHKKLLEISNDQVDKLYELGYVALFANFECFMFEFLKELFKKYPNSFETEKVLKYDDVKDFKNVRDVKEYFIDSIAVEKTHSIEDWVGLLSKKFGIKIFKTDKDLKRFYALSSLRNLILHSGSKTNSKFRKEMRQFLKAAVPLGRAFNVDRKKFFGVLYVTLNLLINNIEKS